MTSFVTYLSSPPGPVSAIPDARARRTSSQANSNSSSSNDPAPASTGRRASSPPGSGRSTDVSWAGPALDLFEGGDMSTSVSVITTLSTEPRPADQASYTVSAKVPASPYSK
jgi:hypothetical protein